MKITVMNSPYGRLALNGFNTVSPGMTPIQGFNTVNPGYGTSVNNVLNQGYTPEELELYATAVEWGDPLAINGLKDWIKRIRARKEDKRMWKRRKQESKLGRKEERADVRLDRLARGESLGDKLANIAGTVASGLTGGQQAEVEFTPEDVRQLDTEKRRSWWNRQSKQTQNIIIWGSVGVAVAGTTFIVYRVATKDKRKKRK